MTQSVADKTPIPDKASRRHTDPPGLWICVAAISVTLHLLLFWLLRSNFYSLSQRNSSNPIPVEFVEISSGGKAPSKAKPVSSKRASTTGKPTIVRSSKPATQENLTPKTSTVEDSNAIALGGALPIALRTTPEGAIAFDNTKKAGTSQPKANDATTQPSSQKRVVEQETQSQPQQDPTSEPTPSPQPPEQNQPEPTSQPTPEVTPQAQQPQLTSQPTPEVTPQAQQPEPAPSPNTADSTNTDTQNELNQELGEQNQASNPQNNPTDSTSTDSSPERQEPQQTPSSLPTPEGEVAVGQATPLQDIAPPVNPQQSPPLNEQNGEGTALATWDVEANAVKKDIQENPPQIVGDIKEKELESLALNKELGDQPIEFKAVLLIDSNGEFNSIILYPGQKIPEPQATQYQEYAEKIFKGQKFIPASNNDGSKPPLGELVVRIRIQRKSANSSIPSP
ncbi:hypothetical protein SD81_023970 [Tolypothrix campylonemoides VB511288]|nr:hypothetical protein SD81_023970 [Tolypothrix campylonemoides VB511288]